MHKLFLSAGLLAAAFLTFSCARGSSPGGGGGGGGPVGSSDDLVEPPYLPSLLAAVGAPSSARLHWYLAPGGFEYALFQGTSRSSVYSGAPVLESLSGEAVTVSGLANGTTFFFGLGVREAGATAYVQAGLVLAARPGDPIYVDASASAAGADGSSPATAFPDLRSGLLAALIQGGGNVWVRDGTYAEGFLPVGADVHVFGGFGAGFDIAQRDATAELTVVSPPAGQPGLQLAGDEPAAIVDGLTLDGSGGGTLAIDVDNSDAELRSVSISAFSDRGIRLRNTSTTDTIDVRVSACTVRSCGADGLSGGGALDLTLQGSSFVANVQEGVDVDDLVALEGGTSTLSVEGCSFFGNGAEGLDVDLAATLPPHVQGGTFEVEVSGSRFELNGRDGLLIDEDYEQAPLWDARIVVRACLARANAADGIHLDADESGTVLLHGNRAASNGQDGIGVTSESFPGLIVASSNACIGNLGAGLRASLGNQSVAATHCVFAGNRGGGFLSQSVDSTAVSSIAYLQSTPWTGVDREGCIEVSDPFAGTFENAAEGFDLAVARTLPDKLTLGSTTLAVPGQPLRVAGDANARVIQSANGPQVVLPDLPDPLLLPADVALFAPGAEVVDDHRLPVGSPARSVGMTTNGGPSVDAGPWGAPLAMEPGTPEIVAMDSFHVQASTPPVAQTLGPSESVRVRFSANVDPGSLAPSEIRAVDQNGSELAIMFASSGDEVVIDAPAGGWGASMVSIQVHRGIRSTAGATLATPLVLTYQL